MLTRSQKASTRQTLELVASSGANPPRSVSACSSQLPQQSSVEGGVSNVQKEVVGRLTLLAAGNERPGTSHKCRQGCMTCPQLIKQTYFYSNATGRRHSVIGFKPSSVHCKMQNYIYLLSCRSCNVQYVGESIRPLNQRMNIHRTSKTGCTYSINHYDNVCTGETFSIQIIEKLEGNGYKNGSIDSKMRDIRLKREVYWMKKLRTVYPYGLNEKTKFMNTKIASGKLFPPLARYSDRYPNGRHRKNNIQERNFDNLKSFMTHIHNFSPHKRQNECRKLLEVTKKQKLRKLAEQAEHEINVTENKDSRFLLVIMDTFFTKFYTEEETHAKRKAPKYQLPIHFINKGLDFLNISSILREEDVISTLPQSLQNDEVPSIVFSLGKTIRNKIFNYKDTVANIDISDKTTFGTGLAECDCKNSDFTNKDHNHVLTGDLRIIQNKKLRDLISKGPNFREPKTINWKKCIQVITNGLDRCIDNVLAKNEALKPEDMLPWKTKVSEKLNTG